jgi:hypothetical protein
LKGKKMALSLNINIRIGTSKPKIVSYKKMASLRQEHIPQVEQEKLLLSLCPLNYIEVDYKTDLLHETKKRDTK